jgi:hypothetical protein
MKGEGHGSRRAAAKCAKEIINSAIVLSWNEQCVMIPIGLFRELEAVEGISSLQDVRGVAKGSSPVH